MRKVKHTIRRECPVCNKVFTINGPTQKYCCYEHNKKEEYARDKKRYHSDPEFRKRFLEYQYEWSRKRRVEKKELKQMVINDVIEDYVKNG